MQKGYQEQKMLGPAIVVVIVVVILLLLLLSSISSHPLFPDFHLFDFKKT